VEAPSGEHLRGIGSHGVFAGKTVWSMPERFKVVCISCKALYKCSAYLVLLEFVILLYCLSLGCVLLARCYLMWTSRKIRYSFLPHCMECRRGLVMRILSVCLSVRLSVKRGHCDKTEERSVQIFIPHDVVFILVFWEEWLVGGDSFCLKFWVNRPPLEQNSRFWADIRSIAPQP